MVPASVAADVGHKRANWAEGPCARRPVDKDVLGIKKWIPRDACAAELRAEPDGGGRPASCTPSTRRAKEKVEPVL